MQPPERSFQKAFGLSVAVHIAVFGSALAFAHYGGPFFVSGFRTIQVSLVGSAGSGGGPGTGAVRREPATEATSAAPAAGPAEQPMPLPAGPADVLTGEGAGEPAAVATGAGPSGGNGDPTPAAAAGAGGFAQNPWAELAAALERVKTYPRIARERGIEGTVVVRFHVLSTGAVESITVVRSSGAKVLDDASMRTVQRAAPVPAGQGWVEVPMVYQLKD